VPALRAVVLKVASRCNLNCSYCYVYNKGDSTWTQRPPIMADATFETTLARIRESCEASGQQSISLTFHGGEPCLVGVKRFDSWCERARRALAGVAAVDFCIQTNGTLLDAAWADVFSKYDVHVGISIDGPKETHDQSRVDHRGRGSYDAVERGIGALREGDVPFGILSVIPLGADPIATHRHFLTLGTGAISYLLPDFTHETIAAVRARHGPTPCADFLMPVFDDWWFHGTLDVRIADFWNIARVILGGASEIDTIGNRPALYAFVEADGAIEGLDVLRVCADGMAGTGLNVRDAAFSEIAQVSALHRQAIFEGMPLPEGCRDCPERDTCAGGYLPHRYSRTRGFDNPSVWCADLLKLFALIRRRLGVTVEATRVRRLRLSGVAGPREARRPPRANAPP
jgi:uncharacterized protein